MSVQPNQYSGSAPMPMVPPQVGGPLQIPTSRSNWPMVIGIIAIILGAGGFLIYGCGGAFSLFFQNAMQGALGPGNDATFKAMNDINEKYFPFQVAQTIVATALAILLLVSGIGLTLRRPWSRTTALLWSVARMLFAVVAGFVGYRMSQDMFQAMADAAATSSGNTPISGGMLTMMQGFGVAGIVIGLLWAWALPVFMIIWLLRGKITAEVESWRTIGN